MTNPWAPRPPGTIYCLSDPYKKTVEFWEHRDEGDEPIAPPADYKPPDGYRVIRRRRKKVVG